MKFKVDDRVQHLLNGKFGTVINDYPEYLVLWDDGTTSMSKTIRLVRRGTEMPEDDVGDLVLAAGLDLLLEAAFNSTEDSSTPDSGAPVEGGGGDFGGGGSDSEW